LICPSPAFSGEVDLPKPGQKWIEVRTDHFSFFSNAGKGATRRVAVDLEELRAVLADLTDYELQSPIPTLIYVFRHDRSFEPYKILYQGKAAAISGYFMAREDANYIAISADSRDASRIVFHEYVHYVSANNLGYLPTWFSEGLAEFYSSFKVVDDTVYIGLPIRHHLALLRGSIPIPLDQLLAVDQGSPLYNEKDRKGEFYAESWALVHYLLLGNEERRQQLSRFLDLIQDGTPEGAAFTAAFGTDSETLAREVRGHLRGPRFRFAQATAEIDVETSLSVRQMSYSEVLYRLGDLLASQDRERQERTAYFEASIDADPDNGLALSALAVERERRADWASAKDLYRRALLASPDDPTVLFRWGEFLSRRGDDHRDAVTALTRSTQLDPSFAPAWAALAAIYSVAGIDSPEALAAAETAHRLLPTNDEVAHDLLRMLLRSDQRDRAVKLAETSFRSRPRMRAQAWMMIVQFDFIRARELLRDGRHEEALRRIELAETIADRGADPAFIRQGIESVRRAVAENEGSALNDRAEALFATGDLEGARELLELALSKVDDGPVAASCRRLLDILDHPDRYKAGQGPVIRTSPTKEQIDHFNQLFVANDLAGALEYLKRLQEQSEGVGDPWLSSKIWEIEGTLRYNNYIDTYNRAVDLYNDEDYPEAVRILEELLATLPEGVQADFLRVFLDDARREIKPQ
jgi:tetratricopeptide (TPR) repeat protein